MVNPGEALLNVVTKDKRKMLLRLDQKVRGQVRRLRTPPGADVAPPAERRDLTHTGTRTKRGKPVVSRSSQRLRKAPRKGCRRGGG